MAISRKNRRPIEVHRRTFVWWVFSDPEANGAMTLAVASEDSSFYATYVLAQPPAQRYVLVLGREFPGSDGTRYKRFRCPDLAPTAAVKPSDVRRMIEWCLYTDRQLVEVDYLGNEISSR